MEGSKARTIDKAREYFHSYGYRKASLADLIAEVGISKPTFYSYFRNKEELFNTVMLATYNEFLYAYNQKARRAGSAMEKLDAFVRTYAWFLDAYPLYRDLHRPGNDLLPRWLRSRYSKDLFAEGIEILAALLEEGRDQGIFRIDLDTHRAALALSQLVTVGLSFDPKVFARVDPGGYAIDLDTLLAILAKGVLAPAPDRPLD